MKKNLLVLTLLVLLTGCFTPVEYTYPVSEASYISTRVRTINYTYYDYVYNYPIIYRESIPYYVIWNVNDWIYYPVPKTRYIYIHNYSRPHVWKSNYRLHNDIVRYRDMYRNNNRYSSRDRVIVHQNQTENRDNRIIRNSQRNHVNENSTIRKDNNSIGRSQNIQQRNNINRNNSSQSRGTIVVPRGGRR